MREDLFASPDRQIEKLLASAEALTAPDRTPPAAIDIVVPELGASITEITVAQWRKVVAPDSRPRRALSFPPWPGSPSSAAAASERRSRKRGGARVIP
jgi:hypothetical protein